MMNKYLDFKNNYKVMYEAKDKVTEEAPGPIYASKVLQRIDDKMCISYNRDTGEYVDLKQFKLIYSDGYNLIGSVSGIPAADDIKIVIKDTEGKIVLGEGPEAPTYALTVNCNSSNVILSGAGYYEEGTEVTVIVAPADGYEFAEENNPTLNGNPMDVEMGQYTYTVVMGAEAFVANIEGVVVKARQPEPTAHDLLYYGCPDVNTSLSASWAYQDDVGDSVTITVEPAAIYEGDVFHPGCAINTAVHASIKSVTESGIPYTPLDAAFTISDEVFAGTTYKKYILTDEAIADAHT